MRRPVLPVSGWMPASPLALAAAMALGIGVPAQAQYFDVTGAVSTSPTNLPIPAFDPALNLRPNSVLVGFGAPGSFAAYAGSDLQAAGLLIGGSGTGNGSFSVEGNYESNTTAQVRLYSLGTRLSVGEWGTGSMTISQGALVDASLSTADCATPGNSCRSFIGNGAGSTGTLTITGAGSELRTARTFNVGQTSVYTTAGSGFDFGTPGGTTTATVNVLDGGTLRTQLGSVAFNNAGPNGLGTEKANATVTVDGAGSQWIVTRNSIDNSVAALGIGVNAGANGLVTISGGGKLHIDGTGSPGPNDGINVGRLGGKGTLVVTGAGSSVLTTGTNPFINVGGNSEGAADGSFQVLAGATATTLNFNVGRNGGTGTVTIDGAGSVLTLSGVGTNQSPLSNGPAFATIGFNQGLGGGTGSVTVSNGGQWLISDGGGDGRVSQSGPGVSLGQGANSSGSLTITGAGSKVEITSTSQNPAPGGADNFNPFMAVGRSGGTGELTINGGGRLLMSGNAPVQPGSNRTTTLNVGGDSDAAPGGTGTVKVSGPGSEIRVGGADGVVIVGRNGVGTMDLKNQALLATTIMIVGRGASGSGTLAMDNSSLELSGQWTGNPFGAGLTLGHLGGTGVATITNNSLVTISNAGSAGVGLSLGGTSTGPLGHGELTLGSGSKINFVAPSGPATMTIGRDGSGIATLSGAGTQIDLGTGNLNLATLPTGNGTLNINGGAKVLTGVTSLAGTDDTAATAGGTASVTVSGSGSELRASGPIAFIGVGRGGTGTLSVQDGGKVAATGMSIGRNGGDGTLDVNNATIELNGQQTAGNLVGANLAIGLGGAIGKATISNGSTVNITNYTAVDNAGANLVIGGSGNYPLGSGSLVLSDGSQINVLAAAGVGSASTLGAVTIGNNGIGRAELSGGSTINVGDGSVYVARQVGSAGTLVMNGSTLNAGFVGVGVGSAGIGNALGAPGGQATLTLNDSTINTSRFELGANGLLTGNNGTISAGTDGPVVIAGTISPGNSPGRLRIKCDITMLSGSKLILEINDRDGGPGVDFDIDQLIIGSDSTFDLNSLQIIFSFMGSTNPNEFAASEGGFNLDRFLLASGPDDQIIGGLSSLFGNAQNPDIKNWDDAVNSALFAFESSAYKVSDWTLSPDGKVSIQTVAVVPEPASFALVLLALAAMGALSRRRVARRA